MDPQDDQVYDLWQPVQVGESGRVRHLRAQHAGSNIKVLQHRDNMLGQTQKK